MPLSPDQQATLNARAATALGLEEVHIETIVVRPMDAREADLLLADPTATIRGYVRDERGFAVPAQFTRQERLTDVFAVIPGRLADGWARDPSVVVGQRCEVEAVNDFGAPSNWVLYTTPEAAESDRRLGSRRAELSAAYLEGTSADEGARRLPLAPVHGTAATLSFLVEGVDAEEVVRRAEKALEAEFGPALGSTRKLVALPAPLRRVDVFSTGGKQQLASGLLEAEVPLVVKAPFEVRTHVPNG